MCAYAHVAVREHAYMMHVCVCVNELSLSGEFARLCGSQSNTRLMQC